MQLQSINKWEVYSASDMPKFVITALFLSSSGISAINLSNYFYLTYSPLTFFDSFYHCFVHNWVVSFFSFLLVFVLHFVCMNSAT